MVNVDAPRDVTGYVHRTGRTGRGGRAGTAITLLTPADCALAQQLRDQLAGAPVTHFYKLAGLQA